MVAMTDLGEETSMCDCSHARELKKCAAWMGRLNTKLRDERSAKATCGSSHPSLQLSEKFSTTLTRTKHLFGIINRPKFDLKITDHARLEIWARECAAEDRRHFEHLTSIDHGRTELPCREWSWEDLTRWYLETCSMDRVEEFFALKRLIAPRCREMAAEKTNTKDDVRKREMIGAFSLGASKSVNSAGRYAVVDQSLFLKVPVVNIGRRASMSR